MKNTTTPGRSTIKTAGYSSSVLHATRNAKRAEAEERNEKWAALPLKEKVRLINIRPGRSARQMRRLTIAT